MGTNTANYNLYKPDVDEEDWGATVNSDTLDAVDTQMKVNADAAALNTTHRTSNGTDHSFIDQSVVSGAAPTFTGTNITGLSAANINIADAGSIITATDVEGALQENRTALNLNTTHRTSTGADHSYIDQSVVSGATPTFTGTNFTGLVAANMNIADAGGIITATQVEAALQENRGLIDKSLVATIPFLIDGGGAEITTGVKGGIEIGFACTITQVTLGADQSGSISIDIWKDTYANYPPTVADTITASAVPTITTAVKAQDATITGWTTSIAAGDWLFFNVDSVTTIERCTVSLLVTKT